MRRAVWVGLAARLMCASRDRKRALRNKLPHTDRGGGLIGGHSRNGDRCCSGGCPTHGGNLARSQPGRQDELDRASHGSGVVSGRFGPQEPGELAGDGGDDDLAVVLAGIETTELATEALLGGPGPGHGVRMNAVLAFRDR